MSDTDKTPTEKQPVADAPAAGVIGEDQAPRSRRRKPAKDAPESVAKPVGAVFAVDAGDDELEDLDRLVDQASDFFPDLYPAQAIAAGAFHGMRDHGITQLTRAQARAAIDGFLGATVNPAEEA